MTWLLVVYLFSAKEPVFSPAVFKNEAACVAAGQEVAGVSHVVSKFSCFPTK